MNLRHVILIALLPLFSIGQSQNNTDSLIALIKKSKNFYNDDGQLDSAYHYAEISYNWAKVLKSDSLQVEIVGILSFLEPDLEKSLFYLKESEPIVIKNAHWKALENFYYVRASVYYHNNDDERALVHFLKLDSILQIRKDNIFLQAMTKVCIVNAFHDSQSLNDTSFFPQMTKNIKVGLQIIDAGLKLSEAEQELYNAHSLNVPAAILYEKMGYIYAERKEPQKAIETYQKALNNTISNDNHLRKSSIYHGLANLYNSEKQKDSALYYYKKELEAISKTPNTLWKAISNYKIAEFFNNNGDPQTALKHLKTSDELMLNAHHVREDNKYAIQDILAGVYYNLGDFKKAYEASDKARSHLQLIQTEFNKKNVSELETKYRTDKIEQQVSLLKSQNETVEQQKTNQRNLLLGSLGIVSIAGLFLFMLYRNRQKTTIRLQELDTLKSNFFANISHEFRTPLTLISSPIDDVLSDETTSDKKRHQFNIAKQNAERLLELVNQLLDLSKIDAGHLRLHRQQGNILQLISSLSDAFTYHAEQKNISYIIDISRQEQPVWFDKDALEKIIVNLLSNAIKYTPENGSIAIEAYLESNKLHLKIQNSGKSLSLDERKHIFERFYQANDKNQGTGIGLALVKEFIGLHEGDIEVTSTPSQGTTFRLSLNVSNSSFKNESILGSSISELTSSKIVNVMSTMDDDEEFKDSGLPILLVVEDHDDLRQLLKQIFENQYNVMLASNGSIGIALALENIPDLIISDVMMPEKDGIALTKELKNDERTAHIPIILLTAKADLENQFKGIEIGADDYITKPFDKKLLVLKVEKLIESRRKLQLRYSQELVLLPKDIAITNLDEKFLKKVETILEKNLVEPSFNVTEFSEAVGMSRMQLHRKLKALTGLTASEFIRSQRLKLAAQLLKTSDINMAQVGYSVGFNDHSYFTKCFKEAYNCTPTEFAKRN